MKNTMHLCREREAGLSFTMLDALLRYAPATGELTWKSSSCSRDLAGKTVGHVNNEGYRRFKLGCEEYAAHRIIFCLMTGDFSDKEIDHRNGDRADDRWLNLREASRAEQARNMKMKSSNTSGCNGVYWSKLHSKWRAKITHEGKVRHLGMFVNWFDAVCARKSAEQPCGFSERHGAPHG